MLENRSIYAIEFEENESYIGNEVIAKVNSVEESSDKEKENIIKEVSKKGFYIELENEEKKIIRPAGVIVYKFTQRDE